MFLSFLCDSAVHSHSDKHKNKHVQMKVMNFTNPSMLISHFGFSCASLSLTVVEQHKYWDLISRELNYNQTVQQIETNVHLRLFFKWKTSQFFDSLIILTGEYLHDILYICYQVNVGEVKRSFSGRRSVILYSDSSQTLMFIWSSMNGTSDGIWWWLWILDAKLCKQLLSGLPEACVFSVRSFTYLALIGQLPL